jgi:RecA-family ATPase
MAHTVEVPNQLDAAALNTFLRHLLNGGSPNGPPLRAFGEYREIVDLLRQAYAAGGTPQVHDAWNGIVRRHPQLAALIAQDLAQPERQVRWTADELPNATFPEPQWIVPGIFPEGLIILAGRPKVGTSVLTLQMAHAVSSGGRFLNQRIEHASVLYIAL